MKDLPHISLVRNSLPNYAQHIMCRNLQFMNPGSYSEINILYTSLL
jgi:hypothetical protein